MLHSVFRPFFKLLPFRFHCLLASKGLSMRFCASGVFIGPCLVRPSPLSGGWIAAPSISANLFSRCACRSVGTPGAAFSERFRTRRGVLLTPWPMHNGFSALSSCRFSELVFVCSRSRSCRRQSIHNEGHGVLLGIHASGSAFFQACGEFCFAPA